MDFLFVATAADGKVVREGTAFWDDVPHGLVQLLLQTRDDQVVVAFSSAPGRRFFFCNEGVAVKGQHGMLSAKILGYIDEGIVHEWRMDLITDSGVPQAVPDRPVRADRRPALGGLNRRSPCCS